MDYHIGIAIHSEDENDFIVAALTHQQTTPGFSLYGMSLPYMRDNFDSVVFIRQHTIIKGVNTAVNRSVEKLLIRQLIVPNKNPQVELLVKPALRNLSFVVPHAVEPKHWLLTATQKALELWMRGE